MVLMDAWHFATCDSVKATLLLQFIPGRLKRSCKLTKRRVLWEESPPRRAAEKDGYLPGFYVLQLLPYEQIEPACIEAARCIQPTCA
eukprot:772193-Pelagomonas_calceolata.AAC.3